MDQLGRHPTAAVGDEVQPVLPRSDATHDAAPPRPWTIARGFLAHHYYRLVEQIAAAPVAPVALRRMFRRLVSRHAVFIHVPRAAGRSISHALYGAAAPHVSARFINRLLGTRRADRTTFAVVRDPVSRTVSAFRYLRAGGTDEAPMNAYWRHRLRSVRTFREYLEFLHRQAGSIDSMDPIFRSQAFYVGDGAGGLAVDRLFLLGRDERELTTFLLGHGSAGLERRNGSTGEGVNVDDGCLALIHAIYSRDFDLLERFCRYRPETDGPR